MSGNIEEHVLKSDEVFLASLRSQKELLDNLIGEIESDNIDDVSIRGLLQSLDSNYLKLKKASGADSRMSAMFDFHFLTL